MITLKFLKYPILAFALAVSTCAFGAVNRPKVEKPDLEKIKTESTDPDSRYYYPRLLKMFMSNDTVMTDDAEMTDDDYRYLYFGTLLFLLVISGLGLAAVAWLAFYLARKGRVEGVIAVYAALLLCGYGHVPAGELVFWGVASAAAVALMLLLPRRVSKSTVGMAYITAGGLVGMVVGLSLGTMASLILGSAAGCLLGAFVVGRLDTGRALDFPSRKFFNYVCAKGLPVVVLFSMLGLILSTLFYNWQ